MKFSEQWLREWVNPDLPQAELLEQLTMAGLEVDGVQPVAGDFTGVVVARIDAIEAHPDAEKLRVCTVNNGQEVFQVVCGAPNAREGLVTAFAPVGSVLPGGMKIKKAKLRKVESFGMLCSAAELEVGEDDDGIMDLPASLEPGQLLVDALNLNDTTVDLDLTPNRGDCLSIRGIAREVGVLTDAPVTEPKIESVPATINDVFGIELADPESCPRYLGRIIRGINPGAASPEWMQERLRRCGLRSIDPVVDVTNFVMLELGQPMHAFDLAVLKDKIVVRKPQGKETLTLLDGKAVELDDKTLLITDGSGPVAMAGVMGGERSGISGATQDVFLECAYFAPLAVAGTARRYGMHTDASHRYERGVDFELQQLAVERATALLLDIVGGAAGPITEAVSPEHLPAHGEVSITSVRLNALLGDQIPTAEVDRIFRRLDFEVVAKQGADADTAWTIRAPSHRFDINIEADLVEEVCRIYGYNRIPSRRPVTDLTLGQVALAESGEHSLKTLLASMDYQEAITYSFVDPALLDALDPGANPIALANPMSSEQSVMRTTLLPGLVEVLRSNRARQQERVRVFEYGQCFQPGADGSHASLAQLDMVAGAIMGNREEQSWHGKPEAVDFFDIKGDVERLLRWRGGSVAAEFRPRVDPVLHPGQSADVWLGETWLGRVGRLHPELQESLDCGGPVYLFELLGSVILQRPDRRFTPVSRYPAVRRDLALLVDASVPSAALQACVAKALGSVLVDFRLFDVYQGEGIDSAKKSVAMGLTLQQPSATLTDDEIGDLLNQALNALATEFNAVQR